VFSSWYNGHIPPRLALFFHKPASFCAPFLYASSLSVLANRPRSFPPETIPRRNRPSIWTKALSLLSLLRRHPPPRCLFFPLVIAPLEDARRNIFFSLFKRPAIPSLFSTPGAEEETPPLFFTRCARISRLLPPVSGLRDDPPPFSFFSTPPLRNE